MKRTPLAALSLGLLWVAVGCDDIPGAPPPVGGQSGDDGSEQQPVDPHVPPDPCDEEQVVLDEGAAGVFGASADELIAGLGLGASQPLFWVPFDAVANTTFSPGSGQSQITLGIERAAGDVVEHTESPLSEGVRCGDPELRVPVALTVTSADGALDEHVATTLTFTSAKTAQLDVQLPSEALGGDFAVEHVGPDGEQWSFVGLSIDVTFWPGGSRGDIAPELRRLDAVVPPSSQPSPPVIPARDTIDTPFIPEHWRTVAVWPQREVCDDGVNAVPFDADEAVSGLSPVDLVNDFVAASPWTMSGANAAQVAVEVVAPRGLVCVSTLGARQELDVRATLRPVNAPAGSPLEHLDATTILRVGARISLDGSRFEELSWQRRDVVYEIPRADFQQQTGLGLAAPDEYRDFWWSWHGHATRDADAAGTWRSQGALLASSLDAQQATQIAAQVAAGGPGAGVGVDTNGFPLLPGDLLVDEHLAP
jgi:hypothetical protein